jgi:DNA-directed RNA polymerase subunit omega
LNSGARPLVELVTDEKMEIVVQEILQDKIYLDANNQLGTVGKPSDSIGGPPELDLENL